MQLNILDKTDVSVRAGYDCACGCTPSVEYARGATPAQEGCCCGNEFMLAPDAAAGMTPRPGFLEERTAFSAPWGETLHASWLVGSSVHPDPSADDEGNAADGRQRGDSGIDSALDPVCGMTVDQARAIASGLHLRHDDVDYYFCGKGCKLEFGDDPARFLDPAYVPTM
ncbi:MAG: YHS domain-containing protein [Chloroflexi bacterium]|nr:YHS domain-containing protein [Chloroflexota bacterium]